MINLRKRAARLALSPHRKTVPFLGSKNVPGRCVLILFIFLLLSCPLQALAEPGPKLRLQSFGRFDFATLVRYALLHSPSFLRNRLEFQIQSLELKDAHSELLPALEVTTRYYFTRAGEDQNKLNVEVRMLDWNPYAALLKIRSQGIVVDMARTQHFEKLSEGVAKIAKHFYRIHVLDKKIAAQRQLAAMHRKKVNYGTSKGERGNIDPLMVRTWRSGLKGQNLLIKGLEDQRDSELASLKQFIGFHPDYYLPLDTRDAAYQILGGFNGRLVTFAEITAHNRTLKLAAKQEQLQSHAVTASYLALVPQPLLLMENLSNQQDRASGFNLAIGLNYILWDGFRRVRQISRAKMSARKAEIDRIEASQEIYSGYKQLRRALDMTDEQQAFRRERQRLAHLQEEQALDHFKAGELPYENYIDVRMGRVSAALESIDTSARKVMVLIELATMAGGLEKYNARIRY